MEERLDKQMRFMREMDTMKRILRRTRIMDDSRFENDAEHSWHMAVMGAWMTEYAVGAVDPLKAVKMCLIHDVVEIDAGDTYAFDLAAQAGKVERRAVERIFGLLPEEQAAEMRSLWEEFEARETPEAKYAAALDPVQGVLNNFHSGGSSWKAHGVKLSQMWKRIEPVRKGTPQLWEFLRGVVEQSVLAGWIVDDTP